jgi:CRP-like cAMP-binding protein
MAANSKGNLLLQALSGPDRDLVAPLLSCESREVRDVFERPYKRIEQVYFPDTGIASVVAVHPDGRRIEIGIVGSEGMTGTAVVLGGDRSPHSSYIQVAGEGRVMSATALRKAMAQSPSLQAVLLKYVQAFTVQTAHSAIANARATLVERLARWLLMAHDRVAGNVLYLTHEFLSLMMAVRRAGVTEALQSLEERKLIECGRGTITILHRKGIEKIAAHFTALPKPNTGA